MGAPPRRLKAGPAELIGFGDLDFQRVPMLARSSRGSPFMRWMPVGMPRIPPKHLDCVCYLYESEEKAEEGREFGGTGFFVGVPSRYPNAAFYYVVTNHHVAVAGGASVVRLNTKDGGVDTFSFEPHDWYFDTKYDIAVHPISLNGDIHKFAAVPLVGLLSREKHEELKVGVGDDVYMVGRFIDHDGGATNRPAVRFGNISVMPSPIEQPNGKMADAYCIDLHSRSGYSGSPVFVYRTPGYDLEEQVAPDLESSSLLLSGTSLLALLGIHFAQFPERWEIASGASARKESSGVPLVTEGSYVNGLSGMTCVLPSWTIAEVLMSPTLQQGRDWGDDREQARRDREGHPPTPE